MKPEIVPATIDHVAAIAANTRQADRDELWAASCSTPEGALVRALEMSTMAWTGLVDGTPVCMFGVAPVSLLSDSGRPWMIGTAHLDQHPFVFLRRCKPCVDMMLAGYGHLVNYVDQRNVRAIGWLRWLGFSFSEPEPMGPFNMPFIRFEMGRQNHV